MGENKNGFTLIELLVVIAIIALLSSVVLAALNSARSKGSTGAGELFAQSIDNSIGDTALGWWDMTECSGTSLRDQSGYNNTATLKNSPTWSSVDTPTGRGCSINISGSQWIDAGADSSLASPTTFTIAAWVKVPSYGNYNYIFSNDSDVSGPNGYGLRYYVDGHIDLEIWNTSQHFLEGRSVLAPNQWYFVAGSYDGATMRVFVNGSEDGKLAYAGGIGAPAAYENTIGALGNCTGCLPKNISIAGMRIYATAVTSDAMEKMYADEKAQFDVAMK